MWSFCDLPVPQYKLSCYYPNSKLGHTAAQKESVIFKYFPIVIVNVPLESIYMGKEVCVDNIGNDPRFGLGKINVPTFRATLPKGIKDGDFFEFKWNVPFFNGLTGVVVQEIEHPIFTRIGKDLHVDIFIRKEFALPDFTCKVKHLDGKYYSFNVSAEDSQSGTKKISGLGMCFEDENEAPGDLIINIHLQ